LPEKGISLFTSIKKGKYRLFPQKIQMSLSKFMQYPGKTGIGGSNLALSAMYGMIYAELIFNFQLN
jgi:hypothetical protein